MLKWGLTIMIGATALTGAILYGYDVGAIDPYAWLYWKAHAVEGFTENPGYVFLTIHTVCLVVIAVYAVKTYRLLHAGWDIQLRGK